MEPIEILNGIRKQSFREPNDVDLYNGGLAISFEDFIQEDRESIREIFPNYEEWWLSQYQENQDSDYTLITEIVLYYDDGYYITLHSNAESIYNLPISKKVEDYKVHKILSKAAEIGLWPYDCSRLPIPMKRSL